MKILTSRNGIALIGVLTILLVLTLLLPAMFTMSDTAFKFAVEGTDRQRASYFARSLCEMAVATYKNTYNVENPGDGIVKELQEKYAQMFTEAMENNVDGTSSVLAFKPVTMYLTDTGDVVYDIEKDAETGSLTPIGTGTCEMTYVYDEVYMLLNMDTGENYEFQSYDDFEDVYKAVKACKPISPAQAKAQGEAIPDGIEEIIKRTIGADSIPADAMYSVSAVKNKLVNFEATVEVKGKKEKRRCVIVLPTYPAEQNWLLYQGPDVGMSNEVFINPAQATGMTTINYNNQGFESKYAAQNLLTFSCLGNMHITTEGLREGKYEWKSDKREYKINYVKNRVKNDDDEWVYTYSDKYEDAIPAEIPVGASSLVFDVSPGINTTPNGDPNAAILDGINSAGYYDQTQADNFVAFTASDSITMELPVMLLVNPTRATRLGDGFDTNYSIYKMVLFQAPTIVFKGQVDMLVSLYERLDNGILGSEDHKRVEARRMSSVVLSAPANSNHTYLNYDRKNSNGQYGKQVRAGKVFFEQDCYVWIINWGDTGSGYSDHWYEVASTVYYRDKDFTKIKVASAGDVCLFNAEIEDKKGKSVGFSIAGYAIETDYLKNYKKYTTDVSAWWQVWTKTQQALFGKYVTEWSNPDAPTYYKDDLHKIGNIYAGEHESTVDPAELVLPDSEDIYTIWAS